MENHEDLRELAVKLHAVMKSEGLTSIQAYLGEAFIEIKPNYYNNKQAVLSIKMDRQSIYYGPIAWLRGVIPDPQEVDYYGEPIEKEV